MKSTGLLQLGGNLHQAGKIHNLHQVWRFRMCRYKKYKKAEFRTCTKRQSCDNHLKRSQLALGIFNNHLFNYTNYTANSTQMRRFKYTVASLVSERGQGNHSRTKWRTSP